MPEDEPRRSPTDAIRSDSLASLRTLSDHPLFEVLGEVFQVEVILDANVVIGDLIWLTATRKNPEARTKLQEVMAAETILPSAPQWLEKEIQRKIPEVARKEGIAEELLISAWSDYRVAIAFEEDPPIPAGFKAAGMRDPKDLPYLLLQRRTGRLIYTEDADLPEMGALTIHASVIAHLRDYSRAAAVRLTVASGGVVWGVLTWEMITAVWKAVKQTIEGFRSLPEWVQVVLVGLLILAVAHPKTRAMALNSLKSLRPAAEKTAELLLQVAGPLAIEFSSADERSVVALEAARAQIPLVEP